jgi:hypothetical protein
VTLVADVPGQGSVPGTRAGRTGRLAPHDARGAGRSGAGSGSRHMMLAALTGLESAAARALVMLGGDPDLAPPHLKIVVCAVACR